MSEKTIIQTLHLHYSDRKSDKVYNMFLMGDVGNARYDIMVEYGRRNATLKKIYKSIDVSISAAYAMFNVVKHQKRNKGYRIILETTEIAYDRISILNRIANAQKELNTLTISNDHKNKLMGMINSQEEETLLLAENIIKQKIVTA